MSSDDLQWLRDQLDAARAEAGEAERARLDANALARDAASRAHQLQAEFDRRDQLRLEAELGPPRRASINLEESTEQELAEARAAGHAV